MGVWKYRRIARFGEWGAIVAARQDGLEGESLVRIVARACGVSKEQARVTVERFAEYERLWLEGNDPQAVYAATRRHKLNSLEASKVLYYICRLNFGQAKEVSIAVNSGGQSVEEYQEKHILPAVEEFFRKENEAQDQSQETER